MLGIYILYPALSLSLYIYIIVYTTQWLEVCLVLCFVVDLNPYQLSCRGSSVGL